jgi:hypothetical protein
VVTGRLARPRLDVLVEREDGDRAAPATVIARRPLAMGGGRDLVGEHRR